MSDEDKKQKETRQDWWNQGYDDPHQDNYVERRSDFQPDEPQSQTFGLNNLEVGEHYISAPNQQVDQTQEEMEAARDAQNAADMVNGAKTATQSASQGGAAQDNNDAQMLPSQGGSYMDKVKNQSAAEAEAYYGQIEKQVNYWLKENGSPTLDAYTDGPYVTMEVESGRSVRMTKEDFLEASKIVGAKGMADLMTDNDPDGRSLRMLEKYENREIEVDFDGYEVNAKYDLLEANEPLRSAPAATQPLTPPVKDPAVDAIEREQKSDRAMYNGMLNTMSEHPDKFGNQHIRRFDETFAEYSQQKDGLGIESLYQQIMAVAAGQMDLTDIRWEISGGKSEMEKAALEKRKELAKEDRQQNRQERRAERAQRRFERQTGGGSSSMPGAGGYSAVGDIDPTTLQNVSAMGGNLNGMMVSTDQYTQGLENFDLNAGLGGIAPAGIELQEAGSNSFVQAQANPAALQGGVATGLGA